MRFGCEKLGCDPINEIKQRDLTDCGPACIASVAAFYDSKIPVAKIRQYAGTDQKGTSAFGLIKAFNSIGMTAKGVKCKPDQIAGIPLPAIAHLNIDNKVLHYVVIYRIRKDSIKIMDPASGRIKTVEMDTFKKKWSGVIIISAPEADYQPSKEAVSNKQRFLFLLKPHKKVYLQAILGAMLYTILGFSTSMYLQKLTDYIIAFNLEKALHMAGIIMLLLLFFQQLFSVMKHQLILKTGQLIDARLILGYFNHLMKLPQTFFDRMRSGEIISRINDAGKTIIIISHQTEGFSFADYKITMMPGQPLALTT